MFLVLFDYERRYRPSISQSHAFRGLLIRYVGTRYLKIATISAQMARALVMSYNKKCGRFYLWMAAQFPDP